MNEKSFFDIWGQWIFGGGFVVFLTLVLSYIARPSKDTIADLRHDIEGLEGKRAKDEERRSKDICELKADHVHFCDEQKRESAAQIAQLRSEHAGEIATLRAEFNEAKREIGTLRDSNFHMRVVFTALSVQYNLVRQELLQRDPNSNILTIRQIVDESHVPLQSVTMFDPASVGFLRTGGTSAPGGAPP